MGVELSPGEKEASVTASDSIGQLKVHLPGLRWDAREGEMD